MTPGGEDGTSALNLQGLSGTSEAAGGCARRLKGLRVLEGPGHGYPCHHPEPLGRSLHSLGEIPVRVSVMVQGEEGAGQTGRRRMLLGTATFGASLSRELLERKAAKGQLLLGGCSVGEAPLAPPSLFCSRWPGSFRAGGLLWWASLPESSSTSNQIEIQSPWPLLDRGWRIQWASNRFFCPKPRPDPEGQAADGKPFSGAAEHRAPAAAAALSRRQGG